MELRTAPMEFRTATMEFRAAPTEFRTATLELRTCNDGVASSNGRLLNCIDGVPNRNHGVSELHGCSSELNASNAKRRSVQVAATTPGRSPNPKRIGRWGGHHRTSGGGAVTPGFAQKSKDSFLEGSTLKALANVSAGRCPHGTTARRRRASATSARLLPGGRLRQLR